jgi:hypothetical protein
MYSGEQYQSADEVTNTLRKLFGKSPDNIFVKRRIGNYVSN